MERINKCRSANEYMIDSLAEDELESYDEMIHHKRSAKKRKERMMNTMDGEEE